jgi:hypothetical protein
MLNPHGRSTQSATVKIPGPPLEIWAVLAAGLIAGLVGIAAIEGARPDKRGSLDVLPVAGSSIERTLQKPIVAGFLAALLLVLVTGAIRRARLRWLAHKPGAIDVADFTADGPLHEGLPRQLSLRFRERLSDLHLAAPGPQPGVAPPIDFVELIGSATRDSKNLLATAAGLLRVAWPAHGYQVQGSLLTRDGDESCGVTVQVLMLPSTSSPPVTYWAHSWPEAVDKAAHHAAAFILPRTRRGGRPPWTGWQGYVMPPELLDCYERSASRARERRYDEALRDLYAATQRDPKNLDLRLRIGFVQEKLGLALDALATYEGICRLGDLCRPRAPFAPSRNRGHNRTRRIAAYRSAILLGAGERLVEQWCARESPPGRNRRDKQLDTFRRRLRDPLEELCKQRYDRTVAGEKHMPLANLLESCDGTGCEALLLREVFQQTSLETLEALRSHSPRWMPLADQTTLTRRAIELSEACVRLRLEHTRIALEKPPQRTMANVAALDNILRRTGLWLDPADAVPRPLATRSRRELRLALRSRRLRAAKWGERYTAASLYALGIVCGGRTEHKELAKRAVRQLEAAVAASDSGYVASRRAWLVSEDPDLDGLRPERPFQRFEATYFPSPQPTVRRPERVHDWEVVQYVRGLVSSCATQRANLWRQRVEGQDARRVSGRRADWWREEQQAWELVCEIAEHCGHWQTRLNLIETLVEWAARYGWTDLPLRYPDYPEAPVDESEKVEAALTQAKEALGDVRALAALQVTRCADLIRAADPGAPRRGSPAAEAPADRTRTAEVVAERHRAWKDLGNLVARARPAAPAAAPIGPAASQHQRDLGADGSPAPGRLRAEQRQIG